MCGEPFGCQALHNVLCKWLEPVSASRQDAEELEARLDNLSCSSADAERGVIPPGSDRHVSGMAEHTLDITLCGQEMLQCTRAMTARVSGFTKADMLLTVPAR